ncbi:MAG: acyl-CoA dehydrogenase family protein [Candidatus Binatia bacterium]|jgi:alkylation response protein AidB-like acyl-CoA dehydrogenase|nr:acyl-CoA dehydrogenase family protein [Candidatus Binatia bacterium]MDG1959470.1 acyl-CoA dehydrogenase family protein [Candidatus Binatia bacterium]MDG2010468.1 acyl-CoA dehydrogenase family protein [Candidatus Binatia bacterium]HAC81194.1 acyl-CoA dehydrogenase [Deltaproteobacteria bacterium]
MFDLGLTEEQELIRETVSSFASEQIRPIARDCDENGSIPDAVVQKGFELGLIQSAIPEQHGGFGEERSAVTGCIVAEELACGDLSIALHLLSPRLVAYPLIDGGTDAQQAQYLPGFSEKFRAATAAVVEPRFDFDPACPDTTARQEDGSWVINGEKCFVPLAADADVLLVTANAGGRVAAFLVNRDTPGVTVREREKNMGIKALATHEVLLENVQVPLSAELGEGSNFDLQRMTNQARLALAALAVGVSRGAYEFALDYAKDRTAFGVAIAQKQAVAFMLADMAIEVDAARLLLWEAAHKLDSGEDASRECFLAKRYAAQACLKITDNAVQVLGGHGYIRDFPVELWLRNARGFSSFEGMALV